MLVKNEISVLGNAFLEKQLENSHLWFLGFTERTKSNTEPQFCHDFIPYLNILCEVSVYICKKNTV